MSADDVDAGSDVPAGVDARPAGVAASAVGVDASAAGVDRTAPGVLASYPQKVPFRVFLDVGHGGYDGGGTGPDGLPESKVNLAVANQVTELLKRAGVAVSLDRTTDAYVSLSDRVAMADASGSDLFVGLYCNASRDPSIRGVTSYYYHDNARAFARYLQDQVAAATGLADDGIMKYDLYVIKNTTNRMTDVLIEYGYISNPTEEQMLARDDFQRRIATSIADAILSYYLKTESGGSPPGAGENPSYRQGDSGPAGPVGPTTVSRVVATDGTVEIHTDYRPEVDSVPMKIAGGDYFVVTFDDAILAGNAREERLGPPFSGVARVVQYSLSPKQVRVSIREYYPHSYITTTSAESGGGYVTIICPNED